MISQYEIKITDKTGRCRWCRCTEGVACPPGAPEGCSWVNRKQTVCSKCLPLDKAMRSIEGRRAVAAVLQDMADTFKFAIQQPEAFDETRYRHEQF